jgi:hypothetical protein
MAANDATWRHGEGKPSFPLVAASDSGDAIAQFARGLVRPACRTPPCEPE